MLWAGSLDFLRERDCKGGVSGQAMDCSKRSSSKASLGESGFSLQKLYHTPAGGVTLEMVGGWMILVLFTLL